MTLLSAPKPRKLRYDADQQVTSKTARLKTLNPRRLGAFLFSGFVGPAGPPGPPGPPGPVVDSFGRVIGQPGVIGPLGPVGVCSRHFVLNSVAQATLRFGVF